MAGQGAANPAGITGVVTDNTGAILPGVTITATSPALQVPSVTSVSDERGEYRLSPLPIGVYTVLFELPGFQNVRREGVRLTVGFTARVDAEMNVGAVSETITVSGASPLVDTTSTATSTELTQRAVGSAPDLARWVPRLHEPGARRAHEPGRRLVRVGRHGGVQALRPVGSPWQMVEGVLTSAPTAHRRAGQPRGLQRDRRDARADGGQQRGDAAARPAGRFRDQIRRQRLSRHAPWRTGRTGHSRATTSTTPSRRRASGWRSCTRCRTSPAPGRPDRPEQALVLRRRPVSEGRTRHPGCVRSRRHADRERQGGRVLLRKGSYQATARESPHRLLPLDQRLRSAECEQVHPAGIDGRQGQSGLDRRRANGKPCAATRWSPRCSTGDGTSGGPGTQVRAGQGVDDRHQRRSM